MQFQLRHMLAVKRVKNRINASTGRSHINTGRNALVVADLLCTIRSAGRKAKRGGEAAGNIAG